MRIILIMLLLLAVSVPAARAQDDSDSAPVLDLPGIKKELVKCGAVVEAMPRLMCYDRIAGFIDIDLAKDIVLREKTLGTYGFWTVTVQKDPLGIQTVSLRLPTSTDFKSASGLPRTPDLVIKCSEKQTNAYVDWKSPLADRGSQGKENAGIYVDYKIDTDIRESGYWDLSLDRMAAFAPDSIAFVRNLKGKKNFIFQLTPLDSAKQTIAYPLDGIDEALDILVKKCYQP